MALFSPVLQQGGGAAQPVPRAVPSTGAATAAVGLEAAAGLLTFFSKEKKEKTKADALKTRAVNEDRFTKSLLGLGELKRTSKNVSRAELNSRADKLTKEFIDANPGSAGDALKIRNEIAGTSSGVGKILSEGTPEQKQLVVDTQSATSAGFVISGGSEAETQEGIANWKRIEKSNAELANIAKKQGVAKETKKVEAQGVLVEFFRGTSSDLKLKANNIAEQVEKGTLDPQEAQRQLTELLETRQETATRIGADAGSEFVNGQMAPANKIVENTLAYIKGDFGLKVMQNKNSGVKALIESKIMEDSDLATTLVASSLAGVNNILLASKLNAGVGRVLAKLTPNSGEDLIDPLSKNAKLARDTEVAYEVVLQNISEFNADPSNATPKEIEDMDTATNRILAGLEENKGKIKSPKDLKTLVTMFANPKYGKYIEQSGGISKAQLALVNETIKVEYLDKIIGKLRTDLQNSRVQSAIRTRGPTPTQPLIDSIDMVPNNGTLNFRVKEGLNPSERAYVTSKTKDLNKGVAPILNEMVRLGAHMEGSTNYSQFLESNFDSVFGLRAQEEQPVVGDSINEQVFTEEQFKIEALKGKGFSKQQMIDMIDTLGLADNGGKQRLLNNIEKVFIDE